ncbi:AraC family transcriptional regulator [Cohnella lubricantis]|uniref:AraC family transcriptional regulator n=1 Tax=Cohnella lubricantis TaxID=2163172 RepID=A0A841TI31_9BACL|nr:AraC family transcriptional regulator [Cohnella lubricantis]MBB6678890.1 AraC family transcriptional regulator [Cohnella lubricantis]MBP2120215.1 AraC family transcriptional regulator [Cohnella lubricantis]
MSWTDHLQKAIDFMEAHLLEDLTIERIAKEAHASPYHFQRTFAILTDMTVGDYLRKRRLTLAAEELCRSDAKVIDLALRYGYDTPESFAKAFRKQHGVTPSEARNNQGRLQAYNRLMIQVTLRGAEPMKYRIVEKEAFQAVGVRREFSLVNGENLKGIPLMWQEVHRDGTNDRLAGLNNGKLEGMLGVCVSLGDQPKMDYWIAAAYEGDVPEGLERLEIPASKWGVFEVRGPMPDAIQAAWKKIFTEWFPSSGYEQAGSPEMEVYPLENAYAADYYSEIWIPLK